MSFPSCISGYDHTIFQELLQWERARSTYGFITLENGVRHPFSAFLACYTFTYMTETNDTYAPEVTKETKRLVHTIIDELLVEENSILSAADRLIAESADGPYKECFQALKKSVEGGGLFFGFFDTAPQYKDLFVHGAIDALVAAENDGFIGDITKMLALNHTLKEQLVQAS